MIIIVQHVIIMTILHTCAGLTDSPPTTKVNRASRSPQICVYCGSIEHSSSNCCRRPWDNREQPCSTPKSLRRDQQANAENLGNAMGRTAPMSANTQGHPPQPQSQRSNAGTSANTGHNNRSSQYYRNYNYDYRESQKQPHTRFDKRYNQRYSPPIFPPTPSLNSSFPEVLSKSLLQIAGEPIENNRSNEGKSGSTGSGLQRNDKD